MWIATSFSRGSSQLTKPPAALTGRFLTTAPPGKPQENIELFKKLIVFNQSYKQQSLMLLDSMQTLKFWTFIWETLKTRW